MSKQNGRLFQIFVAFSEKLNFILQPIKAQLFSDRSRYEQKIGISIVKSYEGIMEMI